MQGSRRKSRGVTGEEGSTHRVLRGRAGEAGLQRGTQGGIEVQPARPPEREVRPQTTALRIL